jgi:N-acetylglucosaminyldiphosphoundecaprenol N-acetyl-beta-D-mannosaminyltransferase
MRELVIILGTPIDDVTMVEALDRIEEFVAIGRLTGKRHQIATVNADFVVKALYDTELRRILQEADLATADGMPLVWSARRLGVPLGERVTGADMVPALAERAAEKGYSIYFLGAAPGVAEQAARILQRRYPGLKVAGVASPSPQAVQSGDPAIIAACNAAKPDILLVAFGNPKQEKWIYQHAHELAIPVMMGVGGTFDLIAGVTRRAPQWMQVAGLEWLYRLSQEPRRLWKRYAVDLLGFGSFFLGQWWVMRNGSAPTPRLPTTAAFAVRESGRDPGRSTAVLTIHGRLDRGNQSQFAEKASRLLKDHPELIINLAQAQFLDSSAIGTLVALTKQARDSGGNLWLAAIPPAIFQVFSLLRLDQFFDICQDVESALQLHRDYQQPDRAAYTAGRQATKMTVTG